MFESKRGARCTISKEGGLVIPRWVVTVKYSGVISSETSRHEFQTRAAAETFAAVQEGRL